MDLGGHRIEARGGNTISGELVPNLQSIHGAGGRGIVDHAFQHLTTKRVVTDHSRTSQDRRAQVTGFIRRTGHRLELIIDVGRLAKLLKVEEEECLVFPVVELGNTDRTTERKSVIVASSALAWIVRYRLAGQERIAGVEDFVDEIVVGAAVIRVGPGPHRDVEQATAHLSVFGREVTGLNRGLLDRIDARLGLLRDARGTGVGSVLTFDAEGLRVGGRPVDSDQRVGDVVHTRDHLHHVVRVTNARATGKRAADTQDRKVVHLIHIDVVTQSAAFGIE